MNKQQTAIDWLIEQMPLGIRKTLSENGIDFQKAKEMEKEQIMDAYSKGADDEYNLDWNPLDRRDSIDCEQYYNETYEN